VSNGQTPKTYKTYHPSFFTLNTTPYFLHFASFQF
jgi:hypothetical protein